MSTAYHSAGNTEANEKQGLAALLQQSTVGIAKTGVLTGLAVTQTATASTSVQIAQGAGVVGSSLTAGASLLTNPDPTFDVLTANPVGSLPRNDIVVFDSVTAKVAVIVGSPNASPVDPTVPNTALKLARIRNAANATNIPASALDDLRVFTSLLAPTPADTQWVTSGFTAGSGWAIGSYMKARMVDGRYIDIRGEVKKTGSAVRGANYSDPAPGNLSPDQTLVTVPAAFCPVGIGQDGLIAQARSDGTAGPAQLFPSGAVLLTSVTTNGIINVGEAVRFSFFFLAG